MIGTKDRDKDRDCDKDFFSAGILLKTKTRDSLKTSAEAELVAMQKVHVDGRRKFRKTRALVRST